MRVAIVHYHLKRGGVTRVIESTLDAFATLNCGPQCVVLAGEVPDSVSFKEQAHCIDGLHYSNSQASTPAPEVLLQRMRTTARAALGGDPDVWHIHNHSLGKNHAIPGLVSLLAKSGARILLHMHDFAEDGRPENYRLIQEQSDFAEQLYPDSPNVHYAVLNARDYQIFRATGIAPERLHLLANPVESDSSAMADNQQCQAILNTLNAQRLILYPVRAVRRKNFGEMLLWAALANDGDIFATTLGPTNPNYVAAYRQWQAVAKKHRLPVHFGISETYDWPFSSIMQSASAILNTSIAEGFGLAFLEPWLFDKSIVGRDLPSITADFKAHGIKLDHLYPSIPIPEGWINMPHLETTIRSELIAAYAAYNTKLPPDAVELAINAIRPKPGYIDFAGLDEPLQEAVIQRVVEQPEARKDLPKLNISNQPETIRNNAVQTQKAYCLSRYGETLDTVYRSIRTAPSLGKLSATTILKGFLQPELFRLLRT